MFFIYLIFFSTLAFPASQDGKQVCGKFHFIGEDEFKPRTTEKKVLCGDPNIEAWQKIPTNQAISFLKTFLQQEGFHSPSFDIQGTEIFVHLGPKTRASKFQVHLPAELEFPIDRMRHVVGETLTPELLDQVTERLKHRMRGSGSACPTVRVVGDPTSGIVDAKISGSIGYIKKIARGEFAHSNPEVLSRYEAFHTGDVFNGDFLELSSRRVVADSVAQNLLISTDCADRDVSIDESVTTSNPRIVRFAIGFDTEKYLFLRSSWKNSRLGQHASSIEAVGSGSLKDQELQVNASLYYSNLWRHYFRIESSFRHENIDPYEIETAKVGVSPALNLDSETTSSFFQLGPVFNIQRTLRGVGPSFSRFISLVAQMRHTDHYFELYRESPSRGSEWTFSADVTSPPLSSVSAQMINLNGQQLWNLFNYDPPQFILGVRGRAATVFVEENQKGSLPATYRMFLGGSRDLKGFGFDELPNQFGALTVLMFGVEARLADTLPIGIQPIAFIDAAKLSERSVDLTDKLYWNPGFGIRWETPVGSIRTTLAHGFVLPRGTEENHTHWQLYFSLGEEF